jgi:hypothetical protein
MNGTPVDDAKQQRREAMAASKRQLHDELRRILDQRAAVERQLEALKARGIAVPSASAFGALARPGSASLLHAASPAAAGKRPAPAAYATLDHPNKRQRILDARRSRVRELFKACKGIVSQLKKNASASPFLTPVDPVKSGATDYYRLITQPMDMSTVLKKLEGQYTSPLEFATDMRLVWRNCAAYNAAGTAVATMGAKMEAAFEQKWQTSGIEHKWAEEQALQQRENEVRCRHAAAAAAAAGAASAKPPRCRGAQRCRSRPCGARCVALAEVVHHCALAASSQLPPAGLPRPRPRPRPSDPLPRRPSPRRSWRRS